MHNQKQEGLKETVHDFADLDIFLHPEKVKAFFPKDHTHTNKKGAKLNALTAAELIKKCRDSKLHDYILLPNNHN